MPFLFRLKLLYRQLGRLEKIFLLLFAVWLVWDLVAPDSLLQILLRVTLFFVGGWLSIRVARAGMRKLIWRLRNRLYVAYVFIAVVPVVLILVLVGIGIWMTTSQVAVYLVTNELERRTNSLRTTAEWLARQTPGRRSDSIRQMAPYLRERFPNIELLIQDANDQRFPADSKLESPPKGWGDTGGLLLREDHLYAWGHAVRNGVEATLLMPLSSDFLASLVPHLGAVDSRLALEETQGKGGRPRNRNLRLKMEYPLKSAAADRDDYVPPPANQLDFEVQWWSILPAAVWMAPGETQSIILSVRSRPSAVLRVLSAQRSDVELQGYLPIVFMAVAILFLIVEIVALIIGISLTRTITRAVHELYQGTQQIMHGQFGHRIEVRGNDQIADLSRSFNRMSENLERLLAVAKEKERLQSELEIAREVQNQLFPKSVPALTRLRITASCAPARLVSGDYYDYQAIGDSKAAIAIGDVAGKGISAALLMATLQSSLRTQLRASAECAVAAGHGRSYDAVSTSRLVSQLNLQLYADTAPEKFATFYFSVYDDETGSLTYTNAGHLPPILLRKGQAIPLNVNGMVVGAFPFAEYGESRMDLESGDLVVCYTDGITEPENEYGEMFGEERLIEVVRRNLDRGNDEIIVAIMNSVRQWTAAPELPDDMTLLLARRL